MTFDDYCTKTGHYAENGDRAMWDAAQKAERERLVSLFLAQAEEAHKARDYARRDGLSSAAWHVSRA